MKKLTTILASLLTVSAAFGQTQIANPNRVLVTDKGGVMKGFVIDYIEDMSFARVDGEVLAKVTVDQVNLSSMRLTIKMTPECKSYKLAVLPQTTANQLGNDANAIRYINSLPSSNVPTLDEDFNNGELSGISLNADSKYSIITIGIDQYGIESGVFRADFVTPAPPIVGNPHVEAKVIDRALDSFTVEFTPNKDVKSYWTVASEKGQMEQQYEQFAPMFGFSNFSEMIQMWGIEKSGVSTNTWSDMAPNGEYEIFVAMTDANGNFAPYEVYETSTLSLGGKGEARVDISLVSFTATDWDGEMLPTQAIKYSPNDQASCYRYGLYEATVYDSKKDEIQKDLCSDPEMNIAYWFQYFEGVAEYQVDVNKEYVAIGAGKNIDGKWGKITELRFKTPATCPGYNGAPVMKSPTLRSAARKAPKVGVIPVTDFTPRKVTLK